MIKMQIFKWRTFSGQLSTLEIFKNWKSGYNKTTGLTKINGKIENAEFCVKNISTEKREKNFSDFE